MGWHVIFFLHMWEAACQLNPIGQLKQSQSQMKNAVNQAGVNVIPVTQQVPIQIHK